MDVEDTWHSSLNSMIFHVVVSWTGLGEKVRLLAWNLQVCICLLYFMDANEGLSICDSEDLAKKFKKLAKLVKFYTRKNKKTTNFFVDKFCQKMKRWFWLFCWVYSGGLRPQYFSIQPGLWRMRQVESSLLHHIQGLMVQIPESGVKYWMNIQEL